MFLQIGHLKNNGCIVNEKTLLFLAAFSLSFVCIFIQILTVSHFKQRKEKNCLNCGAEVLGNYCQKCGQENIETRETFWNLITHFVYDITHFDGKFFNSVKYLLIRPGFLSKEYIKGKRMSYLNPIKMYVFISAIFFLFFYSITQTTIRENKKKLIAAEILKEIQNEIKLLKEEKLVKINNALAISQLDMQITKLNEDIIRLSADTTNLENLNYVIKKSSPFQIDTYVYREQYDSIQASLPPDKKDGFIMKKLVLKSIEFNKEYEKDPRSKIQKFVDKFTHTFPQILFISLPFFALLLKLLFRKRRDLYYADLIIYSIHIYCALFIFIFLTIILKLAEGHRYLGWSTRLIIPMSLYIVWYVYRSLVNVFQQNKSLILLKYVCLLVMFLTVLAILFMAFLAFTIFTI